MSGISRSAAASTMASGRRCPSVAPTSLPSASISGPLCLISPSRVSQVRLSPSKRGIAALEPGDDAQRLGVVVEAAVSGHQARPAPARRHGRRAVWPRSWASASASARSSSSPSARAMRARDLRHLQRMGEPGAVMIALVVDENLRLVLEAAEGGGMDDAVAVALEGRARRACRFVHQPAATFCRIAGIGRRSGHPSPCPGD